jgi:hypothetical protein
MKDLGDLLEDYENGQVSDESFETILRVLTSDELVDRIPFNILHSFIPHCQAKNLYLKMLTLLDRNEIIGSGENPYHTIHELMDIIERSRHYLE